MGGWNLPVDTTDVKTGFEPIASGRYGFQILGAKPNKYEPGDLDWDLQIVSEGPFKGRRTFQRLYNPTSLDRKGQPRTWTLKVMKLIETVTGTPKAPAETGPEYGMRLAQGNSVFSATINLVESTDQAPEAPKRDPKSFINWFSLEPFAG